MNRNEVLLAAARKKSAARREEDAFSSESARVRSWEPDPTIEMVRAFRPKETRSMYAAINTAAKGVESGERISKFRTYG